MTLDLLFAAVQIPLAALLIWQCSKVRDVAEGWLRNALLFVIACSGCMIAWRLATLSLIGDPVYRINGGMGIQTLFLFAFLVLVSAIGKHSGQHKT